MEVLPAYLFVGGFVMWRQEGRICQGDLDPRGSRAASIPPSTKVTQTARNIETPGGRTLPPGSASPGRRRPGSAPGKGIRGGLQGKGCLSVAGVGEQRGWGSPRFSHLASAFSLAIASFLTVCMNICIHSARLRCIVFEGV